MEAINNRITSNNFVQRRLVAACNCHLYGWVNKTHLPELFYNKQVWVNFFNILAIPWLSIATTSIWTRWGLWRVIMENWKLQDLSPCQCFRWQGRNLTHASFPARRKAFLRRAPPTHDWSLSALRRGHQVFCPCCYVILHAFGPPHSV